MGRQAHRRRLSVAAHLPLAGLPTVAVHPARLPLAMGLMVVSGFAGLGYQIVWTQQCALWLGHEAAAVLAVVTAFFGGLALGALALAPRIERSPHPERWSAACELLIALWSLALALLMAPISQAMLALTGVQPAPAWQWTVAFVGAGVLLLPATAAMGATLPAMLRVALCWAAAPTPGAGAPQPGIRQPLAALYACNTLGAVVGVLSTAFWLVPSWGLARTAAVCAAGNLLCAAAVLAVPAGWRPGWPQALPAARRGVPGPAQRRLRLLLLLTGWLGIGYEVLVVRVISQVAEDTVYTFALLLAVYLVGSALGAAAYQRWCAVRLQAGPDGARQVPAAKPLTNLQTDQQSELQTELQTDLQTELQTDLQTELQTELQSDLQSDWQTDLQNDPLTDRLLVLLAGCCLIGSASLWGAEGLRAAVAQGLGGGMAAALAGEAALALLAFGPPTLVMGALFSHLGQQALANGLGFGRALGINTLGAAAAPVCFGVLLVPAFGAKWLLLGVAAGYLLLQARRAWAWPVAWLPAAAALALAVSAPPLVFVDVPEGGRVISYQEGVTAAVSVVEDADGVARLRIDNRQQEGSSASLLADARQALLPLLLHPAPQRALFLGLGTGVTASAAARDPSVQVDAVELLPEVITAAATFRAVAAADGVAQAMAAGPDVAPAPKRPLFANPSPNLSANLHPGLQANPPGYPLLLAADARRYVRTTGQQYDVVVADNFHPARAGSAALYTVEHFQAVRSRLTADGVFCQWLPLHQLDLTTLRSIVQSFLAVYPDGWATLATNSLDTPVLGLVARRSGGRLAWQPLRDRLRHNQLPQTLADYGLADEFALLGGFVAGPQALARFAGAAALNTDDRPVVAYLAPRITYAPDSAPRERLASLLAALHLLPAELVQAGLLSAPAAAHNAMQTAAPSAAPTATPSAAPTAAQDTTQNAVAAQRLAAYWRARDQFILAGMAVRPSADPQAMLRQVREPLLAALRTSPDFRPAYDPLLRLAMALGRSDPAGAQALLRMLQQLQPARPDAATALDALARLAASPT